MTVRSANEIFASRLPATLEKIEKRISQYAEGFLLLEADGEIAGFINSGCAHGVVMSDEAFMELVGHDPKALNVVIMSVVVDPRQQGKGYAKRLMETFSKRIQALGKETRSRRKSTCFSPPGVQMRCSSMGDQFVLGSTAWPLKHSTDRSAPATCTGVEQAMRTLPWGPLN